MTPIPDHPGRDFPDQDSFGHRKAVCARCHTVMNDGEPGQTHGEYWHPTLDKLGKRYRCPNAGKNFDQRSAEVEPFLRKGARRRNRRNGVRP